ncbi:MAG TPA: RidA family protein [Candidatus Dormibacteraeota bacterium]
MKRLNPDTLLKPQAYTQVVEAAGRRTIFVSGQISQDAQGTVVAPGDFPGQARQVFANLRAALQAAGASPADITKMTTFIVDYTPELRAVIAEARSEFLSGAPPPASTLIGISALADPAYLLEIEAIAVID